MDELESGPFAEPTGDISGIDADQVLASLDQPSPSQAVPSDAPAAQTATSPVAVQELAFNWNGKEIKAPFTDPRVKQWASQGYDYAQKIQSLRDQYSEFQQRQKLMADLESKYKPVEDYYSQNPDRWNYVNQQYEILKNGLDPNNPITQKIKDLESKLGEYGQFIQTSQAEKQTEIMRREDQALNDDIQSIRQSYKDLDWNTKDELGKDLEYKILEHAEKLGTRQFRAAFRDLYFDQLQKLTSEKAKEDLIKEKQKQAKQGLLSQSSTPKEGLKNAQNFKHKSYDALIQEGLEELGIASA